MYCVSCGTSYQNEDEEIYCEMCGEELITRYPVSRTAQKNQVMHNLQSNSKVNTTSSTHIRSGPYPLSHSPPITRNPIKWVLLSIFIPFFIYYYAYLNFQDMKKMIFAYHREEGDIEHFQDPLTMVIVFVIFPPLTIYFKFQQFADHLRRSHQEEQKFPDGTGVLTQSLGGILVIFLVFLSIMYFQLLDIIVASALVTVAFGIHLSYHHYLWQREFNLHLQKHDTYFSS